VFLGATPALRCPDDAPGPGRRRISGNWGIAPGLSASMALRCCLRGGSDDNGGRLMLTG